MRSAQTFLVIVLLAVFAIGDAVVTTSRGENLFLGKEPVSGKLAGHADPMPPETVVCANCHSLPNKPSSKQALAAPLDRARLAEAQSRRGGPPSSYNAASFCKVLRTGVDPAFVVTRQEMPRYTLSDAQCNSLWMFLTQGKDGQD
jgi:hypothetical protein